MKKVIFCLLITSVLAGCESKTKQQDVALRENTKTLFVGGVDYTISTNGKVKYFDSALARNIYYALAQSGGGTIKIIGIYSNSLEQDIISIDIPSLDTIEINSIKNVYLRGKAKNENVKRKVNFEEQTEKNIIRFVEATNRKHDCKYSDVANALSLIKDVCEQENFRDYRKIVGLFSDLRNEPRSNRHTHLKPVQLPNTMVACIRPALTKEKLQTLFPLSKVEIITTANDIIQLLNLNKTFDYEHK